MIQRDKKERQEKILFLLAEKTLTVNELSTLLFVSTRTIYNLMNELHEKKFVFWGKKGSFTLTDNEELQAFFKLKRIEYENEIENINKKRFAIKKYLSKYNNIN